MQAIAIALSALMGVQVVFQLLLAVGTPLGRAAWGGQHQVLPSKLRVASAAAAVFFAFSVLVVLSRADLVGLFGQSLTSVFFWVYTIYFGLGIVMNAVSRSKIERIWAPIVAAMFVLSLLMLLRG